jgi:hypothetical protein
MERQINRQTGHVEQEKNDRQEGIKYGIRHIERSRRKDRQVERQTDRQRQTHREKTCGRIDSDRKTS